MLPSMYLRDFRPESPEAVVLLHGQVFDGRLWDEVIPSLAPRRVLVPDFPGHGRSSAEPVRPLADSHVELEAQLLARGVREAFVVGYSLGSWHALGLALRGKLSVKGLYLLGPWPGADAAVLAQFAGLAPLARTRQLDWVEVFLGNCFSKDWAATHPATLAATRERIREGSAHALIEELTHFPAMEDFRPRAGELSMPVLIRVGDADPSTPAVAAEAFAKNVKQCRLEVVPGVAHHYLAQDFEGTVASIKRFVGG